VLTVTSAADMHQDGFLTLREAVAQANADASGGESDTIVFDDSLGQATISLTQGQGGALVLTGTEPSVTEAIDGGGRITVSGNHASQILWINAGVNANVTGLTITDGQGNGQGSGIHNAGMLAISNSSISGNGSTGLTSGGGIYNTGTLTISNCTLSGNLTGHGASGGGLYNAGTATVIDSTINGNTTTSGGGIDNEGTLTVSGCTISGNTADYNPLDLGGGIDNNGALTVTNSTLVGNLSPGGGGLANSGTATLTGVTVTANMSPATMGMVGGLFLRSGMLLLDNSIVAGNLRGSTASDISGGVMVDSTSSYNLIGTGGSGGLMDGVNHNLVGVADAGLGPLADNGGQTQTVALLANSPALDAGDPNLVGSNDQRGVVRDGDLNIGAYQASASAFMIAAPSTTVAGQAFDVTVTAVDPFGQVALGYTGTVTFSSADPYGATLPADSTFAASDNGTQTFPGAATLYTAGTWDVTVTDTSSRITGSAQVAVTPAAAVGFMVTAPATVVAGTPFDFTVTAVDPYGNTDTNYQGTVVFSTMDPAGTLNPMGYTFQPRDLGTATFPGGATLNTPGNTWDVTATDVNSGITGAAAVAVTSGPAPHSSPGWVHESPTTPTGATPDAAAVTWLFASRAAEGLNPWAWASPVEALRWAPWREVSGLVDAAPWDSPALPDFA
jgi:hypothetical protein